MKKTVLRSALVALVLSFLTFLIYVGFKKFINDRTSALLGQTPQKSRLQVLPEGRTQRTYTQKEIEEARRNGTLPRSLAQPVLPPTNPGDAAVQRSLKTLEEINKINEMNQRLQDQQRRLQNNR